MQHLFKSAVLGTAISLGFVSCSSDDDIPQIINEEEIITTVVTTFTSGDSTVTLRSYDSDGDGPTAPEITVSGNFIAGTNYTGTVKFLNESVTPTEDITLEVMEESDEHQVFYQQNGLGSITYNDQDANGNPLGLNVGFQTSANPANGNLTITLIHEPNKNAAGVSDGDITNAGGSTDAQVTFSIAVE